MANLPPILTVRPETLTGSASVLRLFIDGVCPLFLNESAGRATFAMPDVPHHSPRLVFDPFGTPVFLPFLGHFELSITRTGGPSAPLDTFSSNDERDFKNIVDIESQLHGAQLTLKRSTIPASLKVTEGTIYSAQLTGSEIGFVRKGDPAQTEILKQRVTKIIGIEIPISPGDVVSISNPDATTPAFALQVTQPNQPLELLIGNMCGDSRPLLNAGIRHDFEFVYEMVSNLPDDQRVVPIPGIIPLRGIGMGPVECWAPRFGLTKDLPD